MNKTMLQYNTKMTRRRVHTYRRSLTKKCVLVCSKSKLSLKIKRIAQCGPNAHGCTQQINTQTARNQAQNLAFK